MNEYYYRTGIRNYENYQTIRNHIYNLLAWDKSDFLLANMAFFFIPAGVNVINYLDILKASWLPLLVICLVTTVITFAATAFSIRLTVYLLRRKGGQQHE